MLKRKPKILIVYKCLDYPIRKTIVENIYAFRNYAEADCYYLNLDIGKEMIFSKEPIPDYILKIDFDIILFHYCFIASRWAGKKCYELALQQVLPLKASKAIKAVMPQDEHMGSEFIIDFVNKMDLDIVFSVSPETEWKQLYKGLDFNRVKFHKILTGYLDDKAVKMINKLVKKTKKDIDIGYRARKLPQWLGRHGYMKTLVAEVFKKELNNFNLNTSISTDPNDTFFGDDWYKFMVRCKYMIGVEGGSTVHDPHGDITKNGLEYLKKYPDCTFEEIEQACFPNLDGKLQYIAISPRHLEACATKTCQILVESSFNDILKPGIHYIEIKKDLSNIKEVIEIVSDDKKRQKIVDDAYSDIVESGQWSYRRAVKFVIESSLKQATDPYFSRKTSRKILILKYNHFMDWLSWKKYFYWQNISPRIPNKWTYIIPMIDFLKYIGLKNAVKKVYVAIKGQKNIS